MIYGKYNKTSGFAASARRTVASRLWLCIFNKIGKQSRVTSQQSIRDCDYTYLTKLANSRFATVALHI